METVTNLFDRFGGIRPMAEILGEAPSTVQSWKAAGRIPAGKQPLVMERGAAKGIAVTAHDVVFPMGDGPDLPPCDHELQDKDHAAARSTGKTREVSPAGVAA